MMEFGILGPVQAVRDGRVLGLGGPRRRAMRMVVRNPKPLAAQVPAKSTTDFLPRSP